MYEREMARKRKAGEEVPTVYLLPEAKCSQPLLFGNTLDGEVKSYVTSIREGGGLFAMDITMAAGRVIV